MPHLSEAQIQRYSRQILLKEVGGRGQGLLLSRPVQVVNGGPVFSVAAAYLVAGGSPLRLGPEVVLDGFLEGVSLGDFNPDVAGPGEPWLTLSWGVVAADTPAAVAVGEGVSFHGPDGCRACFARTSALLGQGRLAPVDVVGLGSLVALVVQRLILGRAETLGALRLVDQIPRSVELSRCPRHEGL